MVTSQIVKLSGTNCQSWLTGGLSLNDVMNLAGRHDHDDGRSHEPCGIGPTGACTNSWRTCTFHHWSMRTAGQWPTRSGHKPTRYQESWTPKRRPTFGQTVQEISPFPGWTSLNCCGLCHASSIWECRSWHSACSGVCWMITGALRSWIWSLLCIPPWPCDLVGEKS